MKKHLIIACTALSLLTMPGLTNSVSAADAAKAESSKNMTDYGTFNLQSAAGNRYMEVYGDILFNRKYEENAKIVQQVATNEGIWQKWQVIYRKTENQVKYYELMNLHSGKALTAPTAFAKSGLQLQQNRFKGDDLQLWSIVPSAKENQYKIINKKNGLAVTNLNGSSNVNSAIVQEAYRNEDKQHWIFNAIEPDVYRDDEVVGFFERTDRSLGSAAFDEGTSIPLTWGRNKGKVLWITQDAWDCTQLQPNNQFCCDHFFMYNNSMFVQQSKNDWSPTAPNIVINSPMNRPKQICSNQPGTDWSWPGPGVEIGNKIYINCGEGKGLGIVEQSLYMLTQSEDSLWQSERLTPKGMSGQTQINYATGFVKASDGYVYVFGNNRSNIHVARFLVKDPLTWKFWDGKKWVNMPVTGDAASVGKTRGPSAIGYCNGKYVMITMDNGFMCNDKRNIYASTANSPYGPFSEPVPIYQIKEYFFGNYARYYTPSVHPQFDNGHSELLITYCLNFSGCGVESCQNGYLDPYFYRVKGLRVPFSKIGL